MNYQLYNLMQICGGTFPSGGFSQSWGLETYVTTGQVTDTETLKEFLEVYLTSNIGKCEGPIIIEAYNNASPLDIDKLKDIEEMSNAVKITRESREAGLRMGKAFFRIMKSVIKESSLDSLDEVATKSAISYPVVYGVVCRLLNIEIEDALKAYVFSTANAIVQSAVKLVPLGNTEAQQVLFDMMDIMNKTVSESLETDFEDISNFCPGMDIAGIKHETLAIRLYMS